ncbi:HTTM domain-containing protein [Sulfitobacter geojensis]|uniref:HTTM domain-containing protein n=1 Tax=Sulfitobacter geojensis TaxID=1342299 RepID=UPI00248F974E|nr:HTTM domain-containing protein [Sulfitobacter geojensis]
MSFDAALRVTEILLALAFLQQCSEHILGSAAARGLFMLRAGLSLLLLFGIYSPWVLLALSLHSIFVLHRFDGPYNGGSDRMGLLILYCLCLARLLPEGLAREAAFGYLGVQVVLSYFISGWVKIVNPDWRSGRALRDVFGFSAYPVSENLRGFAMRPWLLWAMAWAVMGFEVVFPLALLHPASLVAALGVAALFHLANACLLGLNRFLWFWIASYPSILWVQGRLMQGI